MRYPRLHRLPEDPIIWIGGFIVVVAVALACSGSARSWARLLLLVTGTTLGLFVASKGRGTMSDVCFSAGSLLTVLGIGGLINPFGGRSEYNVNLVQNFIYPYRWWFVLSGLALLVTWSYFGG